MRAAIFMGWSHGRDEFARVDGTGFESMAAVTRNSVAAQARAMSYGRISGSCGGPAVTHVVVSGYTPSGYRAVVWPTQTDAVAPLPAQEAPK